MALIARGVMSSESIMEVSPAMRIISAPRPNAHLHAHTYAHANVDAYRHRYPNADSDAYSNT